MCSRYGDKLPAVDIFVCTADAKIEPPTMVINTVLSVMSYNYPPEKLSIYLSDDGGSEFTFYALMEASQFSKHWIPFCKKFRVEPRSLDFLFSEFQQARSQINRRMKLYEDMKFRIEAATEKGNISKEVKDQHKGFLEWNSQVTKQDHQSIVQIRVSSEISNAPIILNLDCDMYSNDSDAIKEALCFFMDEKHGHKTSYVQHPQSYNNITKNDIYSNVASTTHLIELAGIDGYNAALYCGTGCFHRRESLCGLKYSENYIGELKNSVCDTKKDRTVHELEEGSKILANCSYEKGTQWGKEMGLMYGCPVEDIITGLTIQCRGWKPVYYYPETRKAFLGIAPTTLDQALVQQKRWSEGMFQIFLSKYCPFIYGHGKIKLGAQMGYCVYLLWAPCSFPTLYYVTIPSICLLHGVALFPEVYEPMLSRFANEGGLIGSSPAEVSKVRTLLHCRTTWSARFSRFLFWVIHQKSRISYDEITNDLCPILSVKQLYRVCTLYCDDNYNTPSVSPDVS
ncbi:Cellulose synthase-like protein E6 [Camellia lanceoleosa]|uniref:Cellulose synthase-like protein E6 n=1 Tax=Camellia lanceoleosa TaxID=1840588 RepID=A0ACC0HQZ5_9ERIC|nr:Cellulose synthase-like protein E6 [Camellia lanceoleosa]